MHEDDSGRFAKLNEFLDGLAKSMTWAKQNRIMLDEFLGTTKHNYQSIAHSRVHGLIAKTGFDLGYIVEIESGFKPNNRRLFRSDIQLWRSNELFFLIEYESTNSSDSRLWTKDLTNYISSQDNHSDADFPKYWLIIYTLPDQRVDKREWYSWDYRKSTQEHDILTRNPHEFYKEILVNPSKSSLIEGNNYPGILHLTDGEHWYQKPLFLINMTISGLEIDYPQRFNKTYHFGR